MKQQKIWKALCITAIIVCVCVLVHFVANAALNALLDWLFAPASLSFSETVKADIADNLGVRIPPTAEFVEGRCYAGKDQSYIYIFEINLPDASDVDATDQYLRETLNMDQTCYSGTMLVSDDTIAIFLPELEEMGYYFDKVIDYEERDFSMIYYQIQGETLQFALVYGK